MYIRYHQKTLKPFAFKHVFKISSFVEKEQNFSLPTMFCQFLCTSARNDVFAFGQDIHVDFLKLRIKLIWRCVMCSRPRKTRGWGKINH